MNDKLKNLIMQDNNFKLKRIIMNHLKLKFMKKKKILKVKRILIIKYYIFQYLIQGKLL